MKYLMLFGDNFEDVEAIATMDVLLRGGDEVVPASMMGRTSVQSARGNILTFKHLIDDVSLDSFDGLIIPGGPGSFQILANMPKVDEIIKYFASNNKLISAICAAPMLIGRLGLLKNKHYTVFPGFEKFVVDGIHENAGVVEDGNFITAKAMYYSIEFGLKIHAHFHGEASKIQLEKSCKGE